MRIQPDATGYRIVLRSDIAFQPAEIDKRLINLCPGSRLRVGREVDVEIGTVGHAEILKPEHPVRADARYQRRT